MNFSAISWPRQFASPNLNPLICLTGETDGIEPFIGIHVIALDQDAKDGRPNHAPPLKQTLRRLKLILNSMQVTLDKPSSK